MTDLHLVRLALDGPGLMAFGRRRRLPANDADEGYLAHCVLGELFGDQAPQPFTIDRTRGRALEILSYASCSHESLREHARSFADPETLALCDLERLASKPMPQFTTGRRLGYEVRVCPIVRIGKVGPHQDHPDSEVDAFLAACRHAGQGVTVDRETVYRTWLTREVERRGGMTLESARMERFQLTRLTRRDHGDSRSSHAHDRPDVSFRGVLQVADATAFRTTLARGLGRHRAFGFGMLLLRPPD